jgi:hypothetical protein
MAEDILHAFLARLAEFAPPAEVRRTEVEFRAVYGGTTAYVKKKDPPEIATTKLGYRIAAGTGFADAFHDLGISRATGYRLLSRRWRCR